nr:hypothetical protein [uncultured Oscillibacter sp.]
MDETRSERGLRAYLEEDEQVLWQGATGAFPLLARDAGALILIKWAWAAAVSAAIVALYFRDSAAVNPLLAALGLMAAPVAERYCLLRLTDRRAVLMTHDGVFYSMALADARVCRVVQGDCLVLGRSLQEERRGQLRWVSCHPQAEQREGCPADQVKGLVFYRVDDAAGAQRLPREGG